ncbi:MAG: CHAT domain-containing protein [Bacteroidia bacterium]|jgi:CHAT domain-containing protein
MDGESHLGAEASKYRFVSVAKAKALHLAMHTVIDDCDPMQSRFAFTGSDNLDDQLLAYELFGMNLSAQLTVLSGCETGIGRNSDGEGVMSLSIVMSLWKANDQSNHSIMKSFYTNLKNGIETSEALRGAKLTFLEDSDALSAHPFYWAPFVLIGTSKIIEIETESSTNPMLWVIGLALVFLLILIERRIRRLT